MEDVPYRMCTPLGGVASCMGGATKWEVSHLWEEWWPNG